MIKSYLYKNSSGDKGVQTFTKNISSKLTEIDWLEFEPTDYDLVVQHFGDFTTRTSLPYSRGEALVLKIWVVCSILL